MKLKTNKKMKLIDQRKAKIRELNRKINEVRGKLSVQYTESLSREYSELNEELLLTRMNKYSSKFFEFIPHYGRNRQQKRQKIK